MQDSFAHCEALVRAGDKDRFLTALFAPAEHRGALFALYAFNLEIARVREIAREPLAGEIRLQWWSDALAGAVRGDVEANPVAAALSAASARYRLPRERLAGLIAERRFDLYDEPMASLANLEGYGEAVSAALILLAAQILMNGSDARIDELARHAGIAHAVVGLLNALPAHAARGQLYVPADVLVRHGAGRDITARRATPQSRAALAELRGEARKHLRDARSRLGAAPSSVLPALLPLALAGPMLARMERRSYDPFVPIEIPQWRRQWLIWRAARNPAQIFC